MMLLAGVSLLQAMAQNEPTVTTTEQYARGSHEAFFRGTFKAVNGNAIKKRGVVYSQTNPLPTIENDSLHNGTLTNNGMIYRLKDLMPATIYYARAYATANDGTTGYGNVVKFSTLPEGSISWGYDDGGDASQNARIRAAVEGCVTYWNQYTSIPDLYLNVHFGASTPTADCSYGGWMRVGPNESYQRTGTIMHEALHAIGVGQHDLWYGASSPLRGGSGTGQWLGDRATELVRFWDNKPTEIVNGDGTHVWPYGINGAQEDNGTELLYIGCSLLAQALGEDGLPPVSGKPYGLAHYSFVHDDTTKYYLKNESETFGLMTSFLAEDANNHLVWKTMTAAQAAADDAAAWYIAFNPASQCYSLKNAATGRYMSYQSSGNNGIVTVAAASASSNERFQLMRSRICPQSAQGTTVTTERGYWMFTPGSGQCLTAANNGLTTTSTFNLANNQTKQRWVILTAQQASAMEDSGLTTVRNQVLNEQQQWAAMMAVPHTELTEDADQTFSNVLSQVESQVASATSIAELNELSSTLATAGKTFLSGVCASSREQLFDLSFLLVNPDFSNGATGWTGYVTSTAAINYNEAEFYQTSATATQTVKTMPRGSYQLRMQGFQRPGSYASVYTDYLAGNSTTNVRLYLQLASKGVYLKNIMSDRSQTSLHSDCKKMSDGSYIPNTMASAAAFFKKGMYENLVEYFTEAGDLKVGLIGTGNSASSYWTCFTNFRLYFMGGCTLDEFENATGIEEMEVVPTTVSQEVFNLAGQRVDACGKGLYLIGGKKIYLR